MTCNSRWKLVIRVVPLLLLLRKMSFKACAKKCIQHKYNKTSFIAKTAKQFQADADSQKKRTIMKSSWLWLISGLLRLYRYMDWTRLLYDSSILWIYLWIQHTFNLACVEYMMYNSNIRWSYVWIQHTFAD